MSYGVNGPNLDFQVKFGLEDQGQLLHNTTAICNKVFNTSEPNLVILAWTGQE